MRSSKKISERHTSYDSLRSHTHSLNEEDRHQAIEALSEMNDPDAVRELIQIFKDCGWRSTQLQILHLLKKFPTQRSLEFLFSVACHAGDLPFAEAAIEALGRTRSAQASKFLIHFYAHAPETLKPAVVAALGEIPDRTLVSEFIKDLPKALRAKQTYLARNLVLTLGELKVREALPFLHEIVVQNENAELVLSALVSIGKTARSSFMLENWEEQFRKNLFEYQIYCSVKTQVHCRSQWKLEFYLSRLFESHEVHPVLPFELHHFSPIDVLEGLKLYNRPAYFKRLCLILSKIDFPQVVTWYSELFNFENLNPSQAETILESLSAHVTSETLQVIQSLKSLALKDRDSLLFKKWFDALATSLPRADQFYEVFFKSSEYAEYSDSHRIKVLNAFFQYGLSVQGDQTLKANTVRIFEWLLLREKSQLVQGRIIRALGALHESSRKILDWVKIGILNPLLTSSCLYYLENIQKSSESMRILSLILKDRGFSKFYAVAILKTLTAQSNIDLHSKDLQVFLQDCMTPESPFDEKLSLLHFLARHPVAEFQDLVIQILQSDPRLRLSAVIALKSFKSEKSADFIGHYLNSEDRSLSGRALDALSGLPGMRAKRLMIDFMRDHPENIDICDKVIRSLESPEMGHEYFINIVDQILARFPTHPRFEALLGFKEKMSKQEDRVHSVERGPEISRIDQELKQRLKGYEKYDETVKSALRSAELTIQHPEIFDHWVDKSSSVLALCKATDLILDQRLGRERLIPALERELHLFQNVLYTINLNEENVSPESVMKALSLEKYFSIHDFPLHKMRLVAQGVLSGRILNENFKILDGLRSWAVVMLLFFREYKGFKPLVVGKSFSNESIVILSKRLLNLQEIRNGAAHRKTFLDLLALPEVRKEVFEVLNKIGDFLP